MPLHFWIYNPNEYWNGILNVYNPNIINKIIRKKLREILKSN